MNDVRRREGAAGLRLRSAKRPSSNERNDDELQSDQGPRGRADDHVEVFPSVEGAHEGSTSLVPRTPPGALPWNRGSTRTFPVTQSVGPSLDDREPPVLISMSSTHSSRLTQAPKLAPSITNR